MQNRIFHRALAVAHFVVAAPLLFLTPLFGLLMAPVFVPGLVWLCVLGSQLWVGTRPNLHVRVRVTHTIAAVLAVLLCWSGVSALEAGERSAARGGGLLSAWGLIPLALGGVLGLLAAASLILVRRPVNRAT